jgi:hypothetical protein
MVLIPNTSRWYFMYQIIDNTETTIIVQGVFNTTYIQAGNNFTVVYGQLIKDYVNSRYVRFFRDEGAKSFADGDAIYDGICEVCHTQTTHFRRDGTGSDQLHNNIGGKAATNCMPCHMHVEGFAHRGGIECIICHGHDPGYEYEPGKFSQGKGTYQSHSTHTELDADDLKGPGITCTDCHDTTNYPKLKDGNDLTNTTVCDNCHSDGGVFDGVNNAVIGAKNNWASGVYTGNALQTGKEKWCAGCHDDAPAYGKRQSVSIVIDDADLESVGWVYWTGSGAYDGDLWYHAAGSGANTATWTPNIPVADTYSVYAWWTADPNRATNAPYTIFHAEGNDTVRVNQKSNGSQWNYLGTYNFAAGTSGYVVLSDDADGYVIADAIKLYNSVYAPNVVGDNTTYGFYETGHGRVSTINCLSCHDASKRHIDHEHRTYDYNDGVTNEGKIRLLVANQGWVIVDNTAADYREDLLSLDDYWTPYISPSPGVTYGRSLHYAAGDNDGDTATFTPTLSQDGNYDVYAWWTPDSNRATNTPYTINYSGGGPTTVTVNQELGGKGWHYLGTYFFDAGTGGSVVISDDADLGKYITADAIKFQLVETKQNVVLSDDANGYVIADAILFEPVP